MKKINIKNLTEMIENRIFLLLSVIDDDHNHYYEKIFFHIRKCTLEPEICLRSISKISYFINGIEYEKI